MELTMTRMYIREQVTIGAALVVLTLLAWGYLIVMGAGANPGMPTGGWSLNLLAMSALMWSVMMLAMMLPSASPMILSYARVHRQRTATGQATPPTWLFVTGYLAIWISFALLAALGQWGLHRVSLLNSAMGQVGPLLGGGLLLAAGVYQFSGLKQACLSKCRSPLSFLMTEWREGVSGTLVMGVRHGAFCTGCCWALMLLMFVGGVMNLAWMAALALYFLLEKLLPRGRLFSRLAGIALFGAGTATLLKLVT